MALQRRIIPIGLAVLGLLLLLHLVTYVIADVLWFQVVGYLSVFWKRLTAQVVLGLLGFGITAVFSIVNLGLVNQYQSGHRGDLPSTPQTRPKTAYFADLANTPPAALKFSWLLGFSLSLSAVLGLVLVYYGQVFFEYLRPLFEGALTIPDLPDRFGIEGVQHAFYPIRGWQILALAGTIFFLLTRPQTTCWAIALF